MCNTIKVGLIIAVCLLSGCDVKFDSETASQRSPDNPDNWTFRKVTETSGAISYICESKIEPPLSVAGKDLTIKNFQQVNAVLSKLGLPPVNRNVSDYGYANNSRTGRGTYHWKDYSAGHLIIHRTIAEPFFKKYNAIWKITIKESSSNQSVDHAKKVAPKKTPVNKKPKTNLGRMRTWKDLTGKYTVRARFLKATDGEVVLRKKDGKEIKVPLEKLSKNDLRFLEDVLGKRLVQE